MDDIKLPPLPKPARLMENDDYLICGYTQDQMENYARAALAATPAPAPLTDSGLRETLKVTNEMVRNCMHGPFWPELEQACRAIERAHGIGTADPDLVQALRRTGLKPSEAVGVAKAVAVSSAPHPDTADADPFLNLITVAEQVARDLRAQDLLLEWQSLFDDAIDAARAQAQKGE